MKKQIPVAPSLFILKALKQEGIDHIFLVPGFVIDPFLPSYSKAGITPIVAAHEGGAAFMADGYGRASQNFGVCMGVGGPGVTNMLTAISAAYEDRSSVLVIAGKIPSEWQGRGTFQDSTSTGVDDISLMRNVTGFAEVVPKEGELGSYLKKAIRVIRGKSLPAFLSIPSDFLQREIVLVYRPLHMGSVESPRIIDTHNVRRVPILLAKSTRIAMMLGNGAVRSKATREIQDFVSKYNIPVITTMRAKGAISESHPMSFGVFGEGGSLQAERIVMGSAEDHSLGKAEVLLVLGATLNENNTHRWAPEFQPKKNLVRVDINPSSVRGREYDECLVMGDVKTFLIWLNENNKNYDSKLKNSKADRKRWTDAIRKTQYYHPKAGNESGSIPIHPGRVIFELRNVAPRNSVLVVDSGAHTFFAGHNWKCYAPNEFLLLSNTGPMGYGIAMGIGAKLARPTQPCICLVGDGSMLMHGMELHTAVRFRIPLLVVVINNGVLGNVYLRVRKFNNQAATALSEIIPVHDWTKFAHALGARGTAVDTPSKLHQVYQSGLKHISRTSGTPFLIDVRCDPDCETPNTI